jgi:hypothetical protein
MNTQDRIARYLRQLPPHVRAREAAQLLEDAMTEIDRLRDAIRVTLDENGHLADGDVCTLIRLKREIATPNPS